MNIYLLDLSPIAKKFRSTVPNKISLWVNEVIAVNPSIYYKTVASFTCGPRSVHIKRASSIKVTFVFLVRKNSSAPLKIIFSLSGEFARGEIFSGLEKLIWMKKSYVEAFNICQVKFNSFGLKPFSRSRPKAGTAIISRFSEFINFTKSIFVLLISMGPIISENFIFITPE